MSKEVKYWGSFTILTGLGATLVAGLLAWVFSTTLENKVTFTPLVTAINKLTISMEEADVKNSIEHKMIVDRLAKMTTKISTNEIKLFRVMEDCNQNYIEFKECRKEHRRNK